MLPIPRNANPDERPATASPTSIAAPVSRSLRVATIAQISPTAIKIPPVIHRAMDTPGDLMLPILRQHKNLTRRAPASPQACAARKRHVGPHATLMQCRAAELTGRGSDPSGSSPSVWPSLLAQRVF